jgi:hypothetical protein
MDPNVDLKLDWNDNVASRGDDVDGDGVMSYDPMKDDFFWDFNSNGVCDTPQAVTVGGQTYTVTSAASPDSLYALNNGNLVLLPPAAVSQYWMVNVGIGEPWTRGDNGQPLYADLNQNGKWDFTEWVDYNGNGKNDLPACYFKPDVGVRAHDFRFAMWEMRGYWRGQRFDFDNNDYAVVIDASAVTTRGVANTQITYPRQLARRLYVTVNAESNGVRDRTGQRFVLPIIQ